MTPSLGQLALLAQAQALSDQMLWAAQAQQWGVAKVLESKRRAIFDQVFAMKVRECDIEAVRNNVLAILDINDQIAELGGTAQAAFVAELKELRLTRSAVRAYGVCAKTRE